MATRSVQPSQKSVWRLAARQHELVTRDQLLAMGMTRSAIRHRLRTGRLHLVAPGVYAISRPKGAGVQLWMAAVLMCGPPVALSHVAGYAHWGLKVQGTPRPEVSVPAHRRPRAKGVAVHRRAVLPAAEIRVRDFIPVTSPALTIIDNANRLGARDLEAAVDDAAAKRLCRPDEVRALAERHPKLPGSKLVREVVDRHSFRLTESELERMVLRLIRAAGLPLPDTQRRTGTGRVDFVWTELGLVVEADSLRYHRTASRQAADARRDAAHLLGGVRTLRVTHWDVKNDPGYVAATIAAAIERCAADAA